MDMTKALSVKASVSMVLLSVTTCLAQCPALAANQPIFDVKKDGPLLTHTKTIKIQTSAGNLTFILEPKWAPETVTQITRLFQNHVYDGTEIARYEKDFVFQISLAESKAVGQPPLAETGSKLIRRIPLEIDQEITGKLKHVKGILSMAHEDANTATNTSSFSILEGTAPHLDYNYTIFGKLSVDKENEQTLKKMRAEWPKHPYIVRTISVE